MLNQANVSTDRAIFLSALACAIGLGGFLAWASIAPLEEGVVARGQLVVSGDRKQIAHFEGGIVADVHVAEGAVVQSGDLLVTLEGVQSESARDEIAQDLVGNLMSLARLEALRDGVEEPAFDPSWEVMAPTVAQEIQEQQHRLFTQQRQSYLAERSVLTTRLAAETGRAKDTNVQLTAVRANFEVARRDLQMRREALAERLDIVANVQRAEREVLALEAELARLTRERNTASRSAKETEDLIAELSARFKRTIEEEAATASREALALQQRLAANDDRLDRTQIYAPISGIVLGLEANTIGGVVRPAEPIMEIVPDSDELVALLRLPPTDREAVQSGQRVEAQLSAYKQYRVPRISGEVLLVSADLREDPLTGDQYYEARVLLDPETLRGLPSVELVPGLPVDAFIASGRSRTFLDYALEPISATVREGLSLN